MAHDEDDTPTAEITISAPPRRFGGDLLFYVQEVVEELRLRDDIEVLEFEIFDPVPQILADTVESGMGRVVPDAIRSFYDHADGFTLRWVSRVDASSDDASSDDASSDDASSDDASSDVGGEIDLFSFGEVFGSWLDRLWGLAPEGDEADEEALDFSWELRGVDQAPHGSEPDFMTVLHATPGPTPAYTLYWHEPGGESFRLSCDFFDYAYFALQARGVYGWQLAYADPDEVAASPRARAAHARFLAASARLFER